MKPINRAKQRQEYIILAIISYIAIQFLALHYGVSPGDNAIDRLNYATAHILEAPFDVFPIDFEVMKVTLTYGLFAPVLFYADYVKRRDTRPMVEHGSAKWNDNLKRYFKKYAECVYTPEFLEKHKIFHPLLALLRAIDGIIVKIPVINAIYKYLKNLLLGNFVKPDKSPKTKNMIFSKEIYMSMDGRKTRRNNNVMVFGGSGAGKSRYFVKPNLLQANCSFVVTDPSGELLETMGTYLEREGYEVKVFNLEQKDHSSCYNPFHYIRDDLGVITMIDTLIKNTNPKGSSPSDPFWEKAETALLQALCFYLVSECNPEDRNFSNVMKLLRCAEVKEGQEDYDSTLDILFKDLKDKNKEHIAVRQYAVFKQAAGKTAQSILVSCSVRLAKFNMEEIHKLTGTDDINFGTIGDRKTALFCITPTGDTSFNFLVSMMYTQIFETLYHHAATECKGKRLPVHVRFLLDEFANIAAIPDFEQKVATMRKFEISCSIIYQTLSQAKTQYKDEWETLIGNCDSLLFLGGSDASTLEYVSKKLGKETIRAAGDSVSKGRQGNISISHNKIARDLLTPDELSNMDNNNCILFIRGEHPFFCEKYPLEEHPAYHLTGDADKDLLYDVKKMIVTGQKRPKTVRNKRTVEAMKHIEYADNREGERQMRRNRYSAPPHRSIKGQELGVVKPLNESVEELVDISTRAEEYNRIQESIYNGTYEDISSDINPEIQKTLTIEQMIEFEGGNDIPPESSMMYNIYGEPEMEEYLSGSY